jgi:hypothetical protein
MNRITRKLAIVALIGVGTSVEAQQSDPRQILGAMIYQVQTGKPNPSWYGAELWQTIAYQTGNTGVYPQLAQLGPVRDITVDQQLPLPIGVLYAMTAEHTRGISHWEFGISTLTNRIEYASFRTEPRTAPSPRRVPLPDPDDEGPIGLPVDKDGDRGSGSGSRGSGSSTPDACRKFPNLCE